MYSFHAFTSATTFRNVVKIFLGCFTFYCFEGRCAFRVNAQNSLCRLIICLRYPLLIFMPPYILCAV